MSDEIVDISKTDVSCKDKKGDNEYEYNGGTTITITKNLNALESNSYLKLTHKPKSGKRIDEVKRDGTDIGISGYGLTCRTVSIYYWSYDTNRDNPLILELEAYASAECYKFRNKQAIKDDNIPLAFADTLDRQNCTLNGAHIISVLEEKSYLCTACKGVTITVKQVNGSGYKGFIHTIPQNQKIGELREYATYIRGLDSDPYKSKNVSVYFSGEKIFWIPLFIQFDQGDYYKYGDDDVWEKDPSIKSSTLSTEIPRQRCIRSSAHQIDLLATKDYKCTFFNVQIKVFIESRDGYIRCRHYPFEESSHLSISSFTIGGTRQSTPTPPTDIEFLYVYMLPETRGTPLLIYVESETIREAQIIWYRRASSGNNWSVEEKPPKQSDDQPSILKKLKEIQEDIKSKPPVIQEETGGSSNPSSVIVGPYPGVVGPSPEMVKPSSSASKGSSLSAGAIAGIVIGCLAGVCLISIATWKLSPVAKSYMARRHTNL